MKKLISILLLIIYSNTSFGVTINFHYCDGKFSRVALFNLGGTVQFSCNHNKLPHKDCSMNKAICVKTARDKAVQQYWIRPGISSFILPHYFEKKESLDYTRLESIKAL